MWCCDESRYLMKSLRKRQKNWIGHVLRHDSLLQKVIEGRFQGKKTPGRPRTMLLDALMQEDEVSVIDYALTVTYIRSSIIRRQRFYCSV